MGLSLRASILVIFTVSLTLISGFYHFVGLSKKNEEQQQRLSTERQLTLVRQLALASTQHYTNSMTDFVAKEQAGRQMGLSSSADEVLNRTLNESEFLAVALLQFDGKDRWQPQWIRQKGALAARWPGESLKTTLLEMPIDGVKGKQVNWFRLQDSNKQPLFAILKEVREGSQEMVAVGLLPAQALQSLTEAFVGAETELVVIDDRGFALAYNEQAYVGYNLAEQHAGVKEVLRRREALFIGNAQNRAQKKSVLAAGKVGDANLYAMVLTPTTTAWAMLPRLGFNLLFFAVGIALLGVILGWWMFSSVERAFMYLTEQIKNIARGMPVAQPADHNPWLMPLAESIDQLTAKESGATPAYIQAATVNQVENKKLDAYREMSVGLAHALKDPLTTVLAQAQLARAKNHDHEVKQNFVVIEREARKARDTVESLLKLAGDEQFPRSKIDLKEVVFASLATTKDLCQSRNVKIQKEISESAMVNVNSIQLQIVFDEIIKNAVEAMEGVKEPTLRVRMDVQDDHVRAIFTDNGKGLTAEQLNKIFDPFYSTKDGSQHKGLGLTVAKGVVKMFNGKIRAETADVGQGVKLYLEFPIANVRAKAKLEVLPGDLARPLTGTDTDHLPAAPALDELTFARIPKDEILSAEELPSAVLRPPKTKGSAT